MVTNSEQKKIRASRLKKLRKMTGLSRKNFANKHSISEGTLQNWETARFGGLSEKGAYVVIEALQKEGIFCNFEWLMYGIGTYTFPYCNESIENVTTKQSNSKAVEKELQTFLSNHNDPASIIVTDDSMEPIFSKNQILAGKKRHLNEISSAINKYCIVELNDSTKLVRFLKNGSLEETFNLISINKNTNASNPYLKDVKLNWAAPIVWIRTV